MKNHKESDPKQDDSAYHGDEIEFADGKGTQLEEAFDVPDKEESESAIPEGNDQSE